MSEMVLDVRSWPILQRQGRILTAFDALGVGASLKVLFEYEPRPLHWRFDESVGHRFAWRQRRLNESLWEITISRIPLADARSVDGFFEECGILAGAQRATCRTISRFAVAERIEANQVIVEQDSSWPYLGFLRSGCVFAMLAAQSGRDQLIFEVLPHETFGEVTVLDGGATAARYVAAGQPAEILIVPGDVITSLVTRDGRFALALSAMCAQRMRSVTGRFCAQISRPTISRLAAAILPYAPPTRGLSPVCGSLRLMNQTQLATAAGTVQTVANRELAKLEQAGAIERRRGRIVRADRGKLAAFL